MAIAIYMGFTKEEIEDAGGVDILLEGQKQFFGSLKDADTQTAVINMDGKSSHIPSFLTSLSIELAYGRINP